MEDVAPAAYHGSGNPEDPTMEFVRGFLGLLISMLRFILGTSVGAGGTLAVSDEPDSEDDTLNSAMRGGLLNYRTERLDDGTDPYGWYKLD